MLSFPGSATQPWHSDGPHMPGPQDAGNGEPFVAPLHAVNVFVPLVDITALNGGTAWSKSRLGEAMAVHQRLL